MEKYKGIIDLTMCAATRVPSQVYPYSISFKKAVKKLELMVYSPSSKMYTHYSREMD